VHRARAALADTATELGAGEFQLLAQYLQQRGIGRGSNRLTLAIDGQRHRDITHELLLTVGVMPLVARGLCSAATALILVQTPTAYRLHLSAGDVM
jgi:hypothetical protein